MTVLQNLFVAVWKWVERSMHPWLQFVWLSVVMPTVIRLMLLFLQWLLSSILLIALLVQFYKVFTTSHLCFCFILADIASNCNQIFSRKHSFISSVLFICFLSFTCSFQISTDELASHNRWAVWSCVNLCSSVPNNRCYLEPRSVCLLQCVEDRISFWYFTSSS